MPFHLSAYTMLLGTTADTDVPALIDDILSINNNHFTLAQPMDMLGAAAMSATLSRAKVASPTMRQLAPPFIRPLILAVKPPTNPNVMLMDHSPFRVQAFEEIQLQATSAIAMGTERFTALVWLSPLMELVPAGNIIPLRWTSTTAAVANVWTSLAITFADTIPSGVYAMILSEHFSAQGIAHRWIVSNQTWRPGYFSFTNATDRLPYAMSKAQFGVMGRFRSNDLPRVQVLCNAADATHEGYLHVMRIGNLI